MDEVSDGGENWRTQRNVIIATSKAYTARNTPIALGALFSLHRTQHTYSTSAVVIRALPCWLETAVGNQARLRGGCQARSRSVSATLNAVI